MSDRGRQQARFATQGREASSRPPLTSEAIESVAQWLRVIAEPNRIRLMEALDAGSATLQGLASQLGTTRQNAHKHLMVLGRAGIVGRREVAGRVHYELADWAGWWVVMQAAESVTTHRPAKRR